MKSQGHGVIVNISTVSTRLVTPHQVHYIASKGGVEALTRALALAMSPYGVRVNAIAPSGARTEINANVEEQRQAWDRTGIERIHRPFPLKREGVPEDYANAVAYLVSDEASYITGVCLAVDGGVSLL
jgi:NAD(P)-dependent dehydrogenase (short-subunit alcohol dehydrogenase family)